MGCLRVVTLTEVHRFDDVTDGDRLTIFGVTTDAEGRLLVHAEHRVLVRDDLHSDEWRLVEREPVATWTAAEVVSWHVDPDA